MEVGAREPHLPVVVGGAILRAVGAGDAELHVDAEGRVQGEATAGGLAEVAVDFVVEVELLLGERAVRDGGGHHEQVVGPELGTDLHAQRRAGGVAGDERGRDAEALVRLALAVLDAEDGVELADEDRGLLRTGGQPFQLGEVGVDVVAEAEIRAAARGEVHAGGGDRGGAETRGEGHVDLVGDEAGRAAGVDAVEAGDGAGGVAEVGHLAA